MGPGVKTPKTTSSNNDNDSHDDSDSNNNNKHQQQPTTTTDNKTTVIKTANDPNKTQKKTTASTSCTCNSRDPAYPAAPSQVLSYCSITVAGAMEHHHHDALHIMTCDAEWEIEAQNRWEPMKLRRYILSDTAIIHGFRKSKDLDFVDFEYRGTVTFTYGYPHLRLPRGAGRRRKDPGHSHHELNHGWNMDWWSIHWVKSHGFII